MRRIALTHSRPLAAVAACRQQYQICTLACLKAAFLTLPQQFVQRRSQSKMSTETFSKAIHLKPTKNSFQIRSYHCAPQTCVKAFAGEVVLGTGLLSSVVLKSVVGCLKKYSFRIIQSRKGRSRHRWREPEIQRLDDFAKACFCLGSVFESKFSDFLLWVFLPCQKYVPMSRKK